MSRFLRNVIAAARRPTPLQPLVPSLYADFADRMVGDASPHTRGALEEPETAPASAAPTTPIFIQRPDDPRPGESRPLSGEERALPALSDEPLPVLQARLTENSPPARSDRYRPPSTPARVPEKRPPPLAIAAAASATASRSIEAPQPRLTPDEAHEREQQPASTTTARVEGEAAARSRVQPLPHEPSVTATHAGAMAAMRRSAEFENRNRGAAGAAPPSNDVEIHIGRIEVTAATPVRAPPKNPHLSPNLSDYLNGRRGRRT
jgi:hypothetical protein